MESLRAFLAGLAEPAAGHRPWPRFPLGREGWLELRSRLATADWPLLGLWADAGGAVPVVLGAFRDRGTGEVAVVSLDCPTGRFPALSPVRPGARRLERAIQDLTGLEADGLDDPRPWIDHDRWRQRRPLSVSPAAPLPAPAPYPFLPVAGEGLHEVPVGPVHAGIIEPGHFRFTCRGETVARLEARLGYTHKGTERLMQRKPPEDAARLAGRLSGDSTVAVAWAFCAAVEGAMNVAPPPRAIQLRAVMAELERLANHLGDLAAICNDCAAIALHAEGMVLRERVLQASDRAFGHRLMMDRVVPGGVAVDLKEEGRRNLGELLPQLETGFRAWMALFDRAEAVQDRLAGTGSVAPDLASRFGVGGFIGRASGQAYDARRGPGYAPYGGLEFTVPTLTGGDVEARARIRIAEVWESLGLLRQLLDRLQPGPARALLPSPGEPAEGIALVEGFRGEVLACVRVSADGRIARAHLRDPSWFQWPLLEVAIHDNILADFPLVNKSFNCSYSGHDL